MAQVWGLPFFCPPNLMYEGFGLPGRGLRCWGSQGWPVHWLETNKSAHLCLAAVPRRSSALGSAFEASPLSLPPPYRVTSRGTETRPFAGWRRCCPCPSRMMNTNHPSSICSARSQAGLGPSCRTRHPGTCFSSCAWTSLSLLWNYSTASGATA